MADKAALEKELITWLEREYSSGFFGFFKKRQVRSGTQPVRVRIVSAIHGPPHVEVKAEGFDALFWVNGSLMSGHMGERYRRSAVQWIQANTARIQEVMEEALREGRENPLPGTRTVISIGLTQTERWAGDPADEEPVRQTAAPVAEEPAAPTDDTSTDTTPTAETTPETSTAADRKPVAKGRKKSGHAPRSAARPKGGKSGEDTRKTGEKAGPKVRPQAARKPRAKPVGQALPETQVPPEEPHRNIAVTQEPGVAEHGQREAQA